ELQVIGDGGTVHHNGMCKIPGLAGPGEFKTGKGRGQRDGCEEHVPLLEEGTIRGAGLLTLPIPGEVVTNTGSYPWRRASANASSYPCESSTSRRRSASGLLVPVTAEISET